MKGGNECTSDSKSGKSSQVILCVVLREVTNMNGQLYLLALLSFLCVGTSNYLTVLGVFLENVIYENG